MSKRLRAITVVVYAIMWAGALVGFLIFRQPPPEVTWAGIAFVAASLGFAVIYSDEGGRLFLMLAGAIGFLSELSGLHLGIPFGHYSYTYILGPQLWGVPLVIGVSWALLAAYMRWHLRWLTPGWTSVLAGALGLVAIDLLVDPVAAGPLGLWNWHVSGAYLGVPAGNFWGWLLVGVTVFGAARVLQIPAAAQNDRRPDGAAYVGLGLVTIYTVTALAEGMYVPAIIGLTLMVAHLASAVAERKVSGTVAVPMYAEASGRGGYAATPGAATVQSQPEAD